ncbi:hypothetical protein PVAND_009943 [Polypedilum vanderplanki]|uniref:BRCT domain-containing protein n=1 Tax=Polypedilum vanderplanki TaxID=319348 RepID=A0A9J6CF80_POLVA|nr:hypothetical protein PVAND_009943 [Polypedilum vanderplanki]
METTETVYKFIQNLEKTTIIVFVKERDGMTERMKKIYEQTKEICNADIRRMSIDEVLMLRNAILSLNPHIFILSEFNGEVYSYLDNIENNHMILGVSFMESILELKEKEYITIPTNHRQIFNAAFNDVNLCVSNIRTAEKKEIAKMLKLMNGKISDKIDSNVTHLITNTTKSVKYLEAAANKIPIYHYQWVQNVWKKCLKEKDHSIRAVSSIFDIYKLPPFFDLKIACTGVGKEEKKCLETLIEENGGEFAETYNSASTDILLIKRKDPTNPKYQNAVKRKIPILKCEWVEESVKAGYSLAYEDFCFKSSSPRDSKHKKKENEANSSASDQSFDTQSDVSFNTTANSISTTATSVSTMQRVPSVASIRSNVLKERKTSIEFIKNFAVQQLKKLDNFLDGYTFYLKDYPEEIFAKMRRIITRCGGSSVDNLNQRFTHVLCYGDVNLKNLSKMLYEKDNCAVPVRAEWLVDCLTKMEPLQETDYIIDLSAYEVKRVPSSPFTKKTLSMLRIIAQQKKDEENTMMMPPPSKIETSSTTDERVVEFKQTLIETNHKKVKQPLTNTVKGKRSSEEDISVLYNNKRRKLFESS